MANSIYGIDGIVVEFLTDNPKWQKLTYVLDEAEMVELMSDIAIYYFPDIWRDNMTGPARYHRNSAQLPQFIFRLP
jgi:hypothetical protein